MNIDWVKKDNINDAIYQSYATLFSDNETNDIIKNVFTEIEMIHLDGTYYFPVTINHIERENSFVCSPYTAYALYSKHELIHKVPNRIFRTPLLFLIKIIGSYLKFGNIDKNIHVNNFLLSTNPYPEWNGNGLKEITTFIQHKYPDHAIIFRSLNVYQHQTLLNQFDSAGYHRIGSRQVYIFDTDYQTWLKHNNNKNDRRIIKKRGMRYLSHDDMLPFLADALTLYNKLYLVKYSPYNPQFTLRYFRYCHEHHLMHFQGYADADGHLKAFAGVFVLGKTITSPLVGYDSDRPQKEGLYIHAIDLIMRYKFDHNILLNLSSGASSFKRLRGGKPSIEYSAVYTKHLSLKRRFIWSVLQFISNKIGVPLIAKYEL